jgi:hypothetical protein
VRLIKKKISVQLYTAHKHNFYSFLIIGRWYPSFLELLRSRTVFYAFRLIRWQLLGLWSVVNRGSINYRQKKLNDVGTTRLISVNDINWLDDGWMELKKIASSFINSIWFAQFISRFWQEFSIWYIYRSVVDYRLDFQIADKFWIFKMQRSRLVQNKIKSCLKDNL